MKKRVLFAVSQTHYPKLFHPDDLDRISRLCDVIPAPVPQTADKPFLLEHMDEANIVITGWGTAAMDEQIMAAATKLELLTHAAGSVKPVVSDALWNRHVRVTSAAAAISFGVAEFCLGLILTATKRAFWAGIDVRAGQWQQGIECFGGPQEIYQQKIGVIGASHVGRHLIRLLQNFRCQVLLFDPYCSGEKAQAMGAQKVETLEELFARCMVVSLNAPSTEQTRRMIRGEHFRLLQNGALFINTARGAIVHEQEMIEELKTGRFVACIDVTDPEPPAADSPLRTLPNVWLTPHEAGTVAQNLLRIGTFVADEIDAFVNEKPLCYEVQQHQLANIG
ncbi:MAG: hydroxyacid dehydrogenase [Phycisphaerales bacterium]